MIILDDWIRLGANLKNACEHIRGKQIKTCTWFKWERLAGASGRQGQKISKRKYTPEQSRMLLAIAYIRKHFPRHKLTYRSVREYYLQYDHLIEEVFDRYVAGEIDTPKTELIKLISLTRVKAYCDRISNRILSRNCWSKWKQNLGIPLRAKEVEEGLAALLVFLACWRENNPKSKLPSKSRLVFMMSQDTLNHVPIASMSTHSQQHEWGLRGCLGKDLPKFLASRGYRVGVRSLYRWNPFFKKKQHYSVSQLNDWLNIAHDKRYGKKQK